MSIRAKLNLPFPWTLTQRFAAPRWTWPLLIPISLLLFFGLVLAAPCLLVRWVCLRLTKLAHQATKPFWSTRAYRWFYTFVTADLLAGFRQQATLEPPVLLERVRHARHFLLAMLAVEWAAMLLMSACAGLACVLHRHDLLGIGTITFLGLHLLTVFPAAYAHSRHARLVQMWRDKRGSYCYHCGYDRRASVLQCPECGSRTRATDPGETPPQWWAYDRLTRDNHAEIPVALLGTLGPALLLASVYIPPPAVGAIILSLTLSILIIIAAAISGTLRRRHMIDAFEAKLRKRTDSSQP